jgi:hypothetical protein
MACGLATRRATNAGLAISGSRVLDIFRAWHLEAYAYTFAALYAGLYFFAYHYGAWLVDGEGTPLFSDFATNVWLTGRQALHGQVALLYDPAGFIKLQQELLGPSPFYYPNWAYPPIFLLVAAPFAAFPFLPAFVAYEGLALLACVVVVTLIVRRRAAIALVLASPFTAWNIGCGQNGLLTASLIGAALLALERHPVLAGIFIGCLTCKPQLGVLFPLALIAARQWRALAGAAATTVVLIALSAAAFGLGAWTDFPRELIAQSRLYLLAGAGLHWGLQETAHGLVRYLGGGDRLAWLAQGVASLGAALIVWLVWRSRVRYPLKAATLAATALVATPYAFAYDMAAIAVPLAFLARDQIDHGLLRGEQTVMIALFLASLAVFPTSGSIPIGVAIVTVLICLILRRAMSGPPAAGGAIASENFSETTSLAGD